ncbi:hypothetical protein BDZ97DRAFT_1670316 [Flammula alnicola]|nr:hypothetical protein BDZ97DRAFT_1670316 [Flammula alnicola]
MRAEDTKEPEPGEKREASKTEEDVDTKPEELPPSKRSKIDTVTTHGKESVYKAGTIERGHIYFFYRPRVELEEAESIEDIKNFYMLLVPRPPEFSVFQSSAQIGTEKPDPTKSEESEMKVLARGADAIPAPDIGHSKKKHYRLITVGKKKLPDPESPGRGGSRRKEMFWASVTAVGDDLDSLEKGLGEKMYETKTRGTRHQEPARLVARGGYAIVNSEAEVPSERESHLGYHISHPGPKEMGDVQSSLGIYSASSFILQVKNPLAPATGPQQVHSKSADYPDWIMQGVFGVGEGSAEHSRGRESYGLRFASCETPELLDYEGAQLLLIAAREGEEGLEKSLGEGRGAALAELEEKEAKESVKQVFDELGMDLDEFPVESLEGSWI